MTSYVVCDNREVVELSAPCKTDGLTIRGRFRPVRRVLTLTDAQESLYAEALVDALEAGTLIDPRAAE